MWVKLAILSEMRTTIGSVTLEKALPRLGIEFRGSHLQLVQQSPLLLASQPPLIIALSGETCARPPIIGEEVTESININCLS